MLPGILDLAGEAMECEVEAAAVTNLCLLLSK